MLIESAEVVHYALPFERIYSTARGNLTERELVLLRLRSEGLEGLGETAAMTLRGADSAAQLAAELKEACEALLIGTEIGKGDLERALIPLRHAQARPELLACVDIAFHDLMAKAEGVPLWRLLGADESQPVHCNATLPMANPSEIARIADGWQADGFDTLKLKVGVPGDIAQVAAVREAVADHSKLRLDANGAWRPDEAPSRIDALGGEAIELVEEPTSGLDGLAEVRRKTSVPIAADESVSKEREARAAVDGDCCDFVALKLAKVGGIRSAVEISKTIDSYMTSALEGPVGVLAAAHTVQAMPDAGLAHGLATERLFSVAIGGKAEWDGPDLILPDAPGLGVALDEELLASQAIS